MQSCTLDLHKLILGENSAHFSHVEHAYDTNDLFNSRRTEINPLKRCVQVCLHFIDFILWNCCRYLETVALICILQCDLLSTFHTQRDMTSYLQIHMCVHMCVSGLEAALFAACKLMFQKLSDRLSWVWQVFCLHFAADRGEAQPVCFCKVHPNPYHSNCILFHLIHPENKKTSDREWTLFKSQGGNVTVQVKLMWHSVCFPLSIF